MRRKRSANATLRTMAAAAQRDQLFKAARSGDVECVRRAVETSRQAFRTEEGDGLTLLHVATTPALVEFLTQGIAVNTRTTVSKETPLHHAAERGDVDVVRSLLALDADLNARDFTGMSPLHLACSAAQPLVVDLLLRNGADANARDHKSRSALHWACHGGSEAIVKRLLASGVPADASDYDDDTPLHVLCRVPDLAEASRAAIAALLLDACPALLNAKNSTGRTPLSLCAGSPATTQLLLSRNASVVLTDSCQRSALHWACCTANAHPDSVRALIEAGSLLNVCDRAAWTPLHYAVSCACGKGVGAVQSSPSAAEIAGLLVQAGAQPSAADLNVLIASPLDVCLFRLLLDAGAAQAPVVEGLAPLGSPLLTAVLFNQVTALTLLLHYGARFPANSFKQLYRMSRDRARAANTLVLLGVVPRTSDLKMLFEDLDRDVVELVLPLIDLDDSEALQTFCTQCRFLRSSIATVLTYAPRSMLTLPAVAQALGTEDTDRLRAMIRDLAWPFAGLKKL